MSKMRNRQNGSGKISFLSSKIPAGRFTSVICHLYWILALSIMLTGCSKKGIRWGVEVGPADGGKYRGLAVGDFNSDDNPDLVGGSTIPGGTKVYWGNGDGTWSIAGMSSQSGEIRSIESADFNEDGFDDIVVSTWGDLKGIHVYFSNGKGGWWEELSPQESWSYEGLDIGDLNNDGHVDIVAANATSDIYGGVSAWFGNGEGVWTEDYGPAKGEIYRDVAIADFNRDGFMDITATCWGVHGGIKVWLGDGAGDWREIEGPDERADFWGVDAADVNGDSYPDIIAGTYMEGLAVWFGGPKYNFKKWEHIETCGSVWGVEVKDFNNDGYPDIAATTFNKKGILFFLNKKGRKWKDLSWQFPGKTNYFGVRGADFNNDGKLDLAAAHPGEGIQVWLQGEGKMEFKPLKVEDSNMFTTRKEWKVYPNQEYSVYFGDFEYNLKDDQVAGVKEIGTMLKSFPYSEVRLEGNADPRKILKPKALVSNNMELSEQRALTVKKALMDYSGLPDEQFSIIAFGDAYPVSLDPAEYWRSRRVDVFVTPQNWENIAEFKGREDDALRLSEQYVQQLSDSFKVEPPENSVFTTINGIPEYKIGPSDQLRITIWEGRNPTEYEVNVQVDGNINFGYVTDLNVMSLTPSQVKEAILEYLSEYFRNPNVTVDVLQYNSKKASLLGEIRALQRGDSGPGWYPLSGKTKVVDFISRYGGPTENADLAQVKVVRAKGQTFYLNLYKAMFEGDVTQNLILDDGDIVFLPSLEVSARKFYILGEVKTPGVYELKDEVRLLEAIMIAGSFTDRASLSRVAVIRGDLTDPEIILANINDIIHKGDQSENIEIRNGDIVFVSRHIIGDINYVLNQILPSITTMWFLDRIVED